MLNRDTFLRIVEKARAAGEKAAKRRYKEIINNPYEQDCGGTFMSIVIEDDDVKKFFSSLMQDPVEGFDVRGGAKGKYSVSIHDMARYQEVTVCVAAAKAALAVFEKELGVKAIIGTYLS